MSDNVNFYLDNVGGDSDSNSDEEPVQNNSLVKRLLEEYRNDNLEDDITPVDENQKSIKQTTNPKEKLVADFMKEVGWTDEDKNKLRKKRKTEISNDMSTSKNQEVKDALKKSVITPEFEKLHAVPRYDESEKKLKMERKKAREMTKGKKWFGLPATEMTDEVKRDLEIIQMRSVLDPKRFYKKNDMKVLPKYFQVGKVMDTPLDYYNNRLAKKERKKTLVDELLADFEFRKYNKRKFKEIIEEKQKTHYKAWRNAKKLKRKKK